MAQYFTNNDNLKSEFRTITYKHGDELTNFTSDLGVFSKDKIDYGSNLLIDTYFKFGRKNVSLLDVGCGYGVIGIILSKYMGTSSTLIDINKRAVHLASINIKNIGVNAKAFESNIYESVEGFFDVIVTNPPIRAGKQTVLTILLDAEKHLAENGELWFVIRKDQGAKSIMDSLKNTYDLEVLEKSKGFFIIFAKKTLTSS
ncbi:MAG: class I SAM-dependent methyltransferase [Erysipelotrichales bacterium]|nr:class I SAM-dependent methyltransferase [Erysipelotrichales bacterium]